MNTGNGFFVKADGTAVSDYGLFEGAQRAVVIDSDGKEFPVDCILGANAMYDVVKFASRRTKKSTRSRWQTLPPLSGAPSSSCPTPLRKMSHRHAARSTPAPKWKGNTTTTTLHLQTSDKTVSCPITNAEDKCWA